VVVVISVAKHLADARGIQTVRAGRTIPTPFILTDDDWALLASLSEPTHLSALPIKAAQRCLHLYKAGYLRTDSQGWVSLSLHGRRELARRQPRQ
jgi:hypothetical protein